MKYSFITLSTAHFPSFPSPLLSTDILAVRGIQALAPLAVTVTHLTCKIATTTMIPIVRATKKEKETMPVTIQTQTQMWNPLIEDTRVMT